MTDLRSDWLSPLIERMYKIIQDHYARENQMASTAPSKLREIAASIEQSEKMKAIGVDDMMREAGARRVESIVHVNTQDFGRAGFEARETVERETAVSIGAYIAKNTDFEVLPARPRLTAAMLDTTEFRAEVYVFTKAQLRRLLERAVGVGSSNITHAGPNYS